jgi:hypothetical protein
VSKLGGVWIDVDRHYFNDNKGAIMGVNNYATINLKPGYQRLNGGQALDFVRYRHTDSDLYRLARQQLFVRAFKQQLSHKLKPGPSLVVDLPQLVGVVTKNIEIGVGGGKAIDGNTLLRYARFIYGLESGHLFQAKIEGLTGYAELSTDPANVQRALQSFLNPDVQAPKKASGVALRRKPKVPVVPPSETTVSVLNGNGRPGAATDASYLLGQRGYRIIVPADGQPQNAPRFDYFRTKVYYDHSNAGARGAARRLANLFGSADVAWVPPEIRPLANDAMIVVVVGQTFHGTLGPAPVDQTPKAQPPNVVSNPDATRGLLREVRGRVPFRLQLPTVLERGSIPDSDTPVRVYKLNRRHKALRLTFKSGNGEYWGIEQTDWAEAPLLRDRSFRHTLKGRRYDMYYNGPHLHMVVLRDRGTTYWVVNTLVDSLSNETMLAIAKGLRPLSVR